MAKTSIDDLRHYAITRSLFKPTSLVRAIERLGFVQADPIRAPARAQDLTLRHRVRGYRAGDLDRRYPKLGIEEDYFINYGYLPSAHQALMHPRVPRAAWSAGMRKRSAEVLEFVRERGAVHPREANEQFAHGNVRNDWGGSSNATTHLLDLMHYRGLLRVARRDNGIRIYAVREQVEGLSGAGARRAQLDALVDIVVRMYAPIPAVSLGNVVRRVRYGAPQLGGDIAQALQRGRSRLSSARVDGMDWYWPADEQVDTAWSAGSDLMDVASQTRGARGDRNDREGLDSTPTNRSDQVFLLAPFDPVVWDRRRFELFWGWAYRFEAYTRPSRRKLGYYALPLLWRDEVIGWGNLSVASGRLNAEIGFVAGHPPRDPRFRGELEAELDRMRRFLGLTARRDETASQNNVRTLGGRTTKKATLIDRPVPGP